MHSRLKRSAQQLITAIHGLISTESPTKPSFFHIFTPLTDAVVVCLRPVGTTYLSIIIVFVIRTHFSSILFSNDKQQNSLDTQPKRAECLQTSSHFLICADFSKCHVIFIFLQSAFCNQHASCFQRSFALALN